MPIPILSRIAEDGFDVVPGLWTALRLLPFIGFIYGLKKYFGGASNRSERLLHSKVVMITVHNLNADSPQITTNTQ